MIASTMRPVLNHRINKTRWVVLRWPTPSMAQLAQMSTEAFEDYFFRAHSAAEKLQAGQVMKLD
jgi:aminopeptidase